MTHDSQVNTHGRSGPTNTYRPDRRLLEILGAMLLCALCDATGNALTAALENGRPLRGLWTHTKGGFYHDGRFATFLDAVNHYDTLFGLHLSAQLRSAGIQPTPL
jgi:hypothetical protein